VASQRDRESSEVVPGTAATPSGSGLTSLATNAPTRSLASPRVLDWSSRRYDGRETFGMSAEDAEIAMRAAPEAAPITNWTVQTGGAVTSEAAVVGASWTAPTANDMLFFGVTAGSGTGVGITAGASGTATAANVFGLRALYATPPTLAWSTAQVGGGEDRSAFAISLDGTEVFTLDTTGKLHCYLTSWSIAGPETGGGGACGGFAVTANAACTTALNGTSLGVNGSAPWVDYASGDIFYGDNCGYLNSRNGQTGVQIWSTQIGLLNSTHVAAFESSPVVVNGILYIGDDMGRLYKVTGATSGTAPVAASVTTFDACSAIAGTAPCAGFVVSGAGAAASPWGIRAAIGYDVTNGHAYAVSNDYVFELASTGTFGNTANSPKHLGSGGTGPMYAAPTLDTTNHYLYTEFNSTLYKLLTPFGATNGVYATLLANRTSDTRSSPLPYSGAVYIGDSSGVVERFECDTIAGAPALDGVTSSNATSFTGGNAVTTAVGIDNKTGNILVGFSTVTGGVPGGTGGIAQVPQTSATSYVCSAANPNQCPGMCTGGTGSGCTNILTDPNNCGACGTVCSTEHIPIPTCTAGVCSGQCADGYVDCNSNRKTDGCETAASCGGCCTATICTPGQMCLDPGYGVNGGNGAGEGACATPAASQLLQVCGTAAEGSSAAVACPTGQPIKQIIFADYGNPAGTCGHGATATTQPAACSGLVPKATCIANTSCAWDTASGTCIPIGCSTLTTQTGCIANSSCTWDSNIASCVGVIGFRHYYGTAPNDTYSPNCAQDISASPLVLSSCVGLDSCSLDAANEVYGNSTANDPVAGTLLPLTPACAAGNNCAQNPCPGVAKSIDVQVSCSACVGKRIFISTAATDSKGSFTSVGGATGIDANVCAANALSAGLTGTYKAWIGDPATGDGTAASRMTHPTNAYYQLPSGTLVAAGWAGLISGTLLNGISEGPTGAAVSPAVNVWTGTSTTGTNLTPDCTSWTKSGAGTSGVVGLTGATGATWTDDTTATCNTNLRFYCVEQ